MKYMMLRKGEILRDGDEWFYTEDKTWIPTFSVGCKTATFGNGHLAGKVGGHGDFKYRRPLPTPRKKSKRKSRK